MPETQERPRSLRLLGAMVRPPAGEPHTGLARIYAQNSKAEVGTFVGFHGISHVFVG